MPDLYAYVYVMALYEKLYKPYTPPQAYLDKGEEAGAGAVECVGQRVQLCGKGERVSRFSGHGRLSCIHSCKRLILFWVYRWRFDANRLLVRGQLDAPITPVSGWASPNPNPGRTLAQMDHLSRAWQEIVMNNRHGNWTVLLPPGHDAGDSCSCRR